MKTKKIVFIGAGNLATHLAKAMYNSGYCIEQVFSRTEQSAQQLAHLVNAQYTTKLSEVLLGIDLYVVSLKDDALISLIPQIMDNKTESLVVHTSGSVPIDVWKGFGNRYGVVYPMQTFSKNKAVDFSTIPIFLEANQPANLALLHDYFDGLSSKVYEATSEQRKKLHLAAVFACNFSNHMYTLSEEILKRYGLPFDAMYSLIDETTAKIHEIEPAKAQTGPAIRGDQAVMDKHLGMLSDMPEAQEIYRLVSQSIQKYKSE